VFVGTEFQALRFLSIEVLIITTSVYLQHCYSKSISQ